MLQEKNPEQFLFLKGHINYLYLGLIFSGTNWPGGVEAKQEQARPKASIGKCWKVKRIGRGPENSRSEMFMKDTITLPRTSRRVQEEEKENVKRQPPYHVILLNDDDHTYNYVIRMLGQLFGHPETRAFMMAKEVDTKGRVIVDTTTLERAELKRDQIHAFGPDQDLPRSKGSMSAAIEPAE
ncbi:MAG TPA: ATP-dependent Clp protease adaptor ClpS [Gemmataceae bacterium]|nr:ATP-dependent Clp protease adaptor ClpS [Gemmataceae bacterium]